MAHYSNGMKFKDRQLYRLQESRCFYCDGIMDKRIWTSKKHTNGCTRDHLLPRSLCHTYSNNKVLCHHQCNHEKANREPTEHEKQLYKYMIEMKLGRTFALTIIKKNAMRNLL